MTNQDRTGKRCCAAAVRGAQHRARQCRLRGCAVPGRFTQEGPGPPRLPSLPGDRAHGPQEPRCPPGTQGSPRNPGVPRGPGLPPVRRQSSEQPPAAPRDMHPRHRSEPQLRRRVPVLERVSREQHKCARLTEPPPFRLSKDNPAGPRASPRKPHPAQHHPPGARYRPGKGRFASTCHILKSWTEPVPLLPSPGPTPAQARSSAAPAAPQVEPGSSPRHSATGLG